MARILRIEDENSIEWPALPVSERESGNNIYTNKIIAEHNNIPITKRIN